MRKEILAGLIICMLAVAISLISGCGKKECQSAVDCISGNKCFTPRCENDGTCSQIAKKNCCGNNICEPASGENSCTCKDCGNCTKQGKVKYNISTVRGIKESNYTYSIYMCDASQNCIVDADPNSVREKTLTGNLQEGFFFKADTLTVINNPFNVDKDRIMIKLELTDKKDTVVSPVTFTKVKVLSGSSLLAEQAVDEKMNMVGDSFSVQTSLKSSQTLVEEDVTIDLEFSYEYTVIDRGKEVLQRQSRKVRLPEKIVLIVPQNVIR